MSYLILGCRGLLAGVFLVSLAGKLRGRMAYQEFVSATATLLAVGGRPARMLAPLTVAAECAVVGTLALPVTVPVGFVLAAGLLACFSGALVRALRRGTTASCHCFGSSTTPVGAHHVARNLVMIAVAAAGLIADLSLGTAPYRPAGIAVTGLVVVVCVLITARLDDLVAVFRGP